LDKFEKETPSEDSYDLEIKKTFGGMKVVASTTKIETVKPHGLFADLDIPGYQQKSVSNYKIITIPDFVRNIFEKIGKIEKLPNCLKKICEKVSPKVNPESQAILEDIYNKYKA